MGEVGRARWQEAPSSGDPDWWLPLGGRLAAIHAGKSLVGAEDLELAGGQKEVCGDLLLGRCRVSPALTPGTSARVEAMPLAGCSLSVAVSKHHFLPSCPERSMPVRERVDLFVRCRFADM